MLVRDNKHIPAEDRDFFILLRIGLWQKVEEPLSENPDWDYIYRLACEQTVEGILADGLLFYESFCYGNKSYYRVINNSIRNAFVNRALSIASSNISLGKQQEHICQLFKQRSLQFALVKGLSVAQHYPKPHLRSAGDIDFLFGQGSYEIAKKIVLPLSSSHKDENIAGSHLTVYYNGISLDLHGSSLTCFKKELDSMLESERIKMFETQSFGVYQSDKLTFPVLNNEYNLLYLLSHILKHFTSHGISIRQICDFAIVLESTSNTLDSLQLNHYILESHIEKYWNILVQFSCQYLGLQTNVDFFIKPQRRQYILCQRIWHDCKVTGNFGQKNYTSSVPNKIILRNVRRVKDATNDFLHNLWYSPRLAITRYVSFYVDICKTFISKIKQIPHCTNHKL